MSLADYEDPAFKSGKESAVKTIAKLILKGPMGQSTSAEEYRRGYNEIIRRAMEAVESEDAL